VTLVAASSGSSKVTRCALQKTGLCGRNKSGLASLTAPDSSPMPTTGKFPIAYRATPAQTTTVEGQNETDVNAS
jgi:hypothetical protein